MSNDKKPVMKWNCEHDGCFNKKKRLKFGEFFNSLPPKISFSDIDAMLEINGNLLLMEWKGHGEIPVGQQILFKRITQFCPAHVLVVEGDAEDMSVDTIRIVHDGQIEGPRDADIKQLNTMIQQWVQWAKDYPVTHQQRIEYHSQKIPKLFHEEGTDHAR